MQFFKFLLVILSIIHLPAHLVAGEIKYGKWTVTEGTSCSLETSSLKHKLYATQFDLGSLGIVTSLEIIGRPMLGGILGWSKCDLHAIGKKRFNFCRNGKTLELVNEDDCSSTLNSEVINEFLYYFSQNPTLSCYSIEDVNNYEVIEIASFDAFGAPAAISEFNKCRGKLF